MKPLTPKQEAFALAFVELGEAKAAAERAGYSRPKQEGHRLTHADQYRHVQARIEELRGEARETSAMSRAERQKMLARIANGELEDPSKNPVGNQLRAIELLGKMEGDFVERREVKHEGGEGLAVQLIVKNRDEARKFARGDGEQ